MQIRVELFVLNENSLRKQPSFFTPGPSATRAGSEEGWLCSQATTKTLQNIYICIPASQPSRHMGSKPRKIITQ